jgi:hypothetical protein
MVMSSAGLGPERAALASPSSNCASKLNIHPLVSFQTGRSIQWVYKLEKIPVTGRGGP